MSFIVASDRTYETATSYLTVSSADEYLKAKKEFVQWSNTPLAEKEALLQNASLAIDGAFSYEGEKKRDTQSLKFPRKDQETVPRGIQAATAFLALLLMTDEALKDVIQERIGKMSWSFYKTKNDLGNAVIIYLQPFIKRTFSVAS